MPDPIVRSPDPDATARRDASATVSVRDPAIQPPDVVIYDPKYYWIFGLLLGVPPLLHMSNENALRLRNLNGNVMGRVGVFLLLYFGVTALAFWDCWRLIRTAVMSSAISNFDPTKYSEIPGWDPSMPINRALDFPIENFLWQPVAIYVVGNIILAIIFMALSYGVEKTVVERHLAARTAVVRPALTVFVSNVLWHLMVFGALVLFAYVIREYNIQHQPSYYRWPV